MRITFQTEKEAVEAYGVAVIEFEAENKTDKEYKNITGDKNGPTTYSTTIYKKKGGRRQVKGLEFHKRYDWEDLEYFAEVLSESDYGFIL